MYLSYTILSYFICTLLIIKQEPVEQQTDEVVVDDDLDLDMDFSKTKKKKKKKKDLDELVAEEERKETEDKDNGMYHKKLFILIITLLCTQLFIYVYIIWYLLTCCTESERSAEYGKVSA